MTTLLEQKIGQLMLVGFTGTNADDLIENIKKYNFGNIILFTRNIKSASQVQDMCNEIQQAAIKYNGTPCFIALDQEGGSVRRIYDEITNTPGAMAIAAASAKYPQAAAIIGSILGAELKALGINLNLAPVVDINSNPLNPIIAIRSFGDDPYIVKKLATDFAKAQQHNGIMSCYKHFLGHGDVDIDSHIDLPRINKTIEELRRLELIPYNEIAADAIMTAHILFDKIDDKFPASISKTIIDGILRKELKYKGLVITDCFEMTGLIQTFSFEEAAVFAINAGTDIITVSHTFGRQLTVRNALLNAVNNGKISYEVLEKSLNRIAEFKKRYALKSPEQEIDFEKNRHLSEKISNASITLASGQPFEVDNGTVVIGVTNYVSSIAEDYNMEKMDIAKIIGEEFGIPYISIDNKNFNTSDMLAFAKDKKVILALSDSHLTLVQKVLYSSLRQTNHEIMLISLRTPYDILDQQKPACHICIYEYTSMSVKSLLKFLHGGKAEGRLPVNLGKYSEQYIRENTSKSIFLDNVIKYMKQNFGQKLTLDNVAEKFLITGGHLCKLFKRKLKKSFVDVLNEIRVGESKRLLNSTNLKVYEVAYLCGYTDSNYFVRLFKNYNGMTPNDYRKNYNLYD